MVPSAEASHETRIMLSVEADIADLDLAGYLGLPSGRIRVVAVRGDADDWAAYASPASWSEQQTREHGSKLHRDDAARIFSILKADRYRR